MPTFDSFLAEQHPRFVDDLISFVAQPSVAATGQGMIDMAALVQQRLERIGAAVRQIPTGGAPILYAEIGSGPRTLLIYNHYDVQPPDPIELWTTPPFEPSMRDGSSTRAACPTTKAICRAASTRSRRGNKRSGRCRSRSSGSSKAKKKSAARI